MGCTFGVSPWRGPHALLIEKPCATDNTSHGVQDNRVYCAATMSLSHRYCTSLVSCTIQLSLELP
jgi:hypothetical protein